jgi:hypothetical protein
LAALATGRRATGSSTPGPSITTPTGADQPDRGVRITGSSSSNW